MSSLKWGNRLGYWFPRSLIPRDYETILASQLLCSAIARRCAHIVSYQWDRLPIEASSSRSALLVSREAGVLFGAVVRDTGTLDAPGAMATKAGEAKISPELKAEVRGLLIIVDYCCASHDAWRISAEAHACMPHHQSADPSCIFIYGHILRHHHHTAPLHFFWSAVQARQVRCASLI